MNSAIKTYNLNEDKEIRNLLKRHGWTVNHFTNDTQFSVSSVDGSKIKNSPVVLSLLVVELLEREEDELEVSNPRLSTVELFEKYGYSVECESPLEVRLIQDDSVFITCEAAMILEAHLRELERGA